MAKRQQKQSSVYGLTTAALFALTMTSVNVKAAMAAEPLQGSATEYDTVNPAPLRQLEPMPAPVIPAKKLEGKAEQTGKGNLRGQAEDDDAGNLQGMTGKNDDRNKVLEGNAKVQDLGASLDPDMDDEDVMVEWDKWRNRFLRAVQQGVQEQLSNTGDLQMRFDPRTGQVYARFPMGTTCWFSCQVTPDRHVVHLKIMQPSGFPHFDQAVIDSVNALEGSALLRYPRNSQRKIVSQAAGIKTSESSNNTYYHFGDTEHYRTQQ